MDAARLQLDEEQHVVAAQQCSVDGEEVAGDDACRLAKGAPAVIPESCTR
jgi:hypothetical protein